MTINLHLERSELRQMERSIDYSEKRNLGSLSLPHRHSNGGQYATFTLPEEGSRKDNVYNLRLDIYDNNLYYSKDNPLISFKGRVVRRIIESILEGSCIKHLEALKDGCDWYIEQLKKKEENINVS